MAARAKAVGAMEAVEEEAASSWPAVGLCQRQQTFLRDLESHRAALLPLASTRAEVHPHPAETLLVTALELPAAAQERPAVL